MNELLFFKKLLLSELRIVSISDNSKNINDDDMTKAMTVNEELIALGYTLIPNDIINLAKSKDVDIFLDDFKNLLGNVKAKPMYPNFPKQVMQIDEATFRFHQLLHYMSTYGVESVTGTSVSKGWLPETENYKEKTVEDKQLLNAKVINLFINSEDNSIYKYAYDKILSKKERMTDKEKLIVSECIKYLSDSELVIDIPFKQNMLYTFYDIFNTQFANNDSKAMQKKVNALHSLCKHTGDVWKCADYVLTKCNFHFTTSQKRLIVKLLESYSSQDFMDNITLLSNSKAKRVHLILQYTDFNKYSRNEAIKHTVRLFRQGFIRSWESSVKELVSKKLPNAIPLVCSHAGTALRMITYLLRNGYRADDIYNELLPKADSLSMPTLVNICKHFSKPVMYWNKVGTTDLYMESIDVYNICFKLLCEKLKNLNTALKNKKVYMNMSEYDLDKSVLLTNSKSSEGGYIRSGIAYKIPNNVNILRFFVYWNDESRVDVDLHGVAHDCDGDIINIGWDGKYISADNSICHSGDITHSNAAEYIDVDLSKTTIKDISFNIEVYNIHGKDPVFRNIRECFVGIMAVDSIGEEVMLYKTSNCIFTHDITADYNSMEYGFVDIENRYLMFVGKDAEFSTANSDLFSDKYETSFTLKKYLETLIYCQHAQIVNQVWKSDVILVMGKADSENDEISLTDNNFFLE